MWQRLATAIGSPALMLSASIGLPDLAVAAIRGGTGSIGDLVWSDLDGDGVQDAGEPGLAAVTVFLDQNMNGELDAGEVSTVTDALGGYDFTGLPAGDYTVAIADSPAIAGLSLTTGNLPLSVSLAAGEDFNDADFGFRGASIGDFVWSDLDGDGVQDVGEPGVDGATVELLDDVGMVLSSTTTAGGGFYSFDTLSMGTYAVRVTAPSGFAFTLQDVGGDDTIDSDVSPGTGQTANFAVGTSEMVTDVDAGLVVPPVIGVAKRITAVAAAGAGLVDVTYELVVENLGSSSLSNVQVTDDLTATFPAPVTFSIQAGPTAGGTLAANGAFNGGGDQNLLNAPGSTLIASSSATITLTVRIAPNGQAGPFLNSATASGAGPTGLVVNDASDDGADPDPNGDGDPTEAAENDPTPLVLGSIGGFVWEDLNGNGVQDGGEPGIAGVVVEVQDGVCTSGVDCATEVTDGAGAYSFVGLAPGSYTVDVVGPPAGLALTTANVPLPVLLTAMAPSFTDADFGYQRPTLEIPTLSEWGALSFVILLALGGVWWLGCTRP